MKKNIKNLTCIFFVLFICSCTTPHPPKLTYLALEKPKEIIKTEQMKNLNKEFSRGGFYFANYNFRPAADIKKFIEQAEKESNTNILRNADIQLNIPFYFDLLIFGYNYGTDYLITTE
ncbi:MAG: hypothetical protein ABIK92_00355 [Pseudomonadota bacterium]